MGHCTPIKLSDPIDITEWINSTKAVIKLNGIKAFPDLIGISFFFRGKETHRQDLTFKIN